MPERYTYAEMTARMMEDAKNSPLLRDVYATAYNYSILAEQQEKEQEKND